MSEQFRELIRILIPTNIRKTLLKYHQNYVFKKAIHEFRNSPDPTKISDDLIARLIYGWGNQGYSAMNGLVKEIIAQASENQGPVLECGTGLSTVLLGIIGDIKGQPVVSLEDHAEWARFIRDRVTALGIQSVEIVECPLEQYENYYWYKVPDTVRKYRYSLVISDGPADKSQLARYGLMPQMQSSLSDKCTILFDDYDYAPYRVSVDQWMAEYPFEISVKKNQDVIAILKNKAN